MLNSGIQGARNFLQNQNILLWCWERSRQRWVLRALFFIFSLFCIGKSGWKKGLFKLIFYLLFVYWCWKPSFLAIGSPEQCKKFYGSGFLKFSFFSRFLGPEVPRNWKNRDFWLYNDPKIRKKWKFQKSAPIEIFVLLWATHSQKTGFLASTHKK